MSHLVSLARQKIAHTHTHVHTHRYEYDLQLLLDQLEHERKPPRLPVKDGQGGSTEEPCPSNLWGIKGSPYYKVGSRCVFLGLRAVNLAEECPVCVLVVAMTDADAWLLRVLQNSNAPERRVRGHSRFGAFQF